MKAPWLPLLAFAFLGAITPADANVQLNTNQAKATAPAGQVKPAAVADGLAGKDIALLFGQLLTAIIAAAAVWASLRNTKRQVRSSNENAEAERWRDANLKEVEQLEELVRTFHVPYLVRSEANHNMAKDLRDRLNDPKYRMLVKLFDPNWLGGLPPGDRTIVDEVCRTGLELREFIEKQGGGIDVHLVEHLARASTHFRMLWLAHEGQLGTDPAPFERYVYPRQLDCAIREDLNRILKRCTLLRSEPSKYHGLIDQLVLPADAKLDPWPDPMRYDPVTGSPGSTRTTNPPSPTA